MPDSGRPTALNSADPIRNFTLSTEERIRALTIGVPAWAARKRKIEDDEVRYTRELVELHDLLVQKGRTPTQIEVALVSAATAFDLEKLNKLVALHNRYYPIEANLPMDYKTGDYLVYGRPFLPESPYTAQRFVGLAQAAIAKRAG
ncbi:MAG: hypothetical protein U0270_30870 [Labilithrix sp.]